MNQAATKTAANVTATPITSSTMLRSAPDRAGPRTDRWSRTGRRRRPRCTVPSAQRPQSSDVEEAHQREHEEKTEHPDVKWHAPNLVSEPSTGAERNFTRSGPRPAPQAIT